MLTIAIQAGGQSSRMGRDKAMLRLNGVPLIERVLRQVVGLGDELLITTNDMDRYSYLGVRLVSDAHPGAGALHGLLTALQAARHEQVLIVGCDMPFLSRPLLLHLVNQAELALVVVPMHDGEFEPLLAIYSKACIPAIEQSIACGKRRMISFFPQIELMTVDEQTLAQLDPQGLSFFNVNTPEDLERAERLLAEQSG